MRLLLAGLAFAPSLALGVCAPALAQSHGGHGNHGAIMISMLDLDQDGKVTSDEWTEMSYPPIVFLGLGLKMTEEEYRDTLTGTNESVAQTAKDNFEKFDRNKDGFFSSEEFAATFVAEFNAMDTDRNGDLSAEEYDKFQTK